MNSVENTNHAVMRLQPIALLQSFLCANFSLSSESSREPAVSTIGLGSESSVGSVASEEAFRPRFTVDPHHGLFCLDTVYLLCF